MPVEEPIKKIDYYAALEVFLFFPFFPFFFSQISKDATTSDIKKAYFRLAKMYFPSFPITFPHSVIILTKILMTKLLKNVSS
jgi:hypothetical protein